MSAGNLSGLCEDTPGENEENFYDHVDVGKGPPSFDVNKGRVR